MPYRIAIVTTHPIQYQAPWFRAMAAHPDLDIQVFFCHHATPDQQAKAGFGVEFEWDIPLLDGYPYRYLKNVATRPSANHFSGLDTPEIGDIIRGQRFDAVINCGWHRKSYWQSIRACWNTNTPVMVRGDSHLHTQRSALKAAIKWPAYRIFIPRMDACLAVGRWSREYFLHYGARGERIFRVPHVVDEPWFRQHAGCFVPCRPQLRHGWNLPREDTVFVWAGKFTVVKRPMDFVRALDAAVRNGARVSGLMAGDGPLRSECESYARQRSVPLTFAGFLNQSEIVKAYIASDALVLSSECETWGLVINEAMVCGRACIVSDQVGCVPDLITADTGAIYPRGDVNRLAALISELAADRERLCSMGALAARKITEYSTQAAVRGVLEAVRAVGR